MSIDRLRAHWGLSRMPFGKDLAPSMLAATGAHNEAVARIGWCVTETALGVITGEVGAGKTVAVRAALAGLDASRHTIIYLGNPGTLTFRTDGLGYAPRLQPHGMLLTWDVIDGITAEGPMEAQKRVTATRMLAVGLFAFAWKKNDAASYLTISTTTGDQVMFECHVHLAKLQQHLKPICANIGPVSEPDAVGQPAQTSSPALDVTEQLERLGALHQKGLLTVEEFQTTKGELLGRI